MRLKGFNHSEVCHMFAHQTQAEAIGANIYYEPNKDGSTIFSYGYHFPMAHRLLNGTFLMTNRTYSSSTGKHLNHLRRALSHENVIEVREMIYQDDINLKKTSDSLKQRHLSNIEYYTTQIEKCVKLQMRARVSDYINEINHYINTLNRYKDTFHCRSLVHKKYKKLIDKHLTFEEVAEILGISLETIKKQVQRQKEVKRRGRNKQKAILKKGLKLWKGNKPIEIGNRTIHEDSFFRFYGENRTFLRFNHKKECVETSKGIRIPPTAANRAIKFIDRIWSKGETWRSNGERLEVETWVGTYKIDSISSDYVVSGCHRIPKNDIIEMKELLNRMYV